MYIVFKLFACSVFTDWMSFDTDPCNRTVHTVHGIWEVKTYLVFSLGWQEHIFENSTFIVQFQLKLTVNYFQKKRPPVTILKN